MVIMQSTFIKGAIVTSSVVDYHRYGMAILMAYIGTDFRQSIGVFHVCYCIGHIEKEIPPWNNVDSHFFTGWRRKTHNPPNVPLEVNFFVSLLCTI